MTRFLNEARASAKLKGEHVARPRCRASRERRVYMVIEYPDGDDLMVFCAHV
ncbi:MAG: hypothetical protein IPM54_12130 [Polyangiaceae bacterium]|nr:hypothetical protein [Polyangiaceae bacterium]